MRMVCKRSLFVFALIVLVCSIATQAGNWPRFRGPNGQGISDEADFPAEWSEQDRAWNAELKGKGHSSPVVWDDRVFVTLAYPETTEVALQAIQISDGRILWSKQYTLKSLKMNRLNSFAASTPAVDADHVYAVWYDSRQARRSRFPGA